MYTFLCQYEVYNLYCKSYVHETNKMADAYEEFVGGALKLKGVDGGVKK